MELTPPAQTAAAWLIVLLFAIDAAFLGYIAWNAWDIKRESQDTFARLDLRHKAAQAISTDAGMPVRYNNADWDVSFELPSGFSVNEERLSAAGDVELRISRRPAQDVRASTNTLLDTGVRVRIAAASGFGRYYSRPYTEYGSFRRFIAVGRPAAGWSDPDGLAEARQIILIDDGRNDREVSVIYKGMVVDAESLALGILNSMRLSDRAHQPTVKSGWKVFSQDMIHFQYPEDYRVSTPTPGRIEVDGKGGRLEIQTAYDIEQTSRPGALIGIGSGTRGAPNEYFDLQYGVDVRVGFFYGVDAKPYDRAVLKDISATVMLGR